MLFIVVKNVFPPIAGIKGLDVKIVPIHLFGFCFFKMATTIKLEVQRFVDIFDAIAVEKVIEKIPINLLLHCFDFFDVLGIFERHDFMKFVLKYFLDLLIIEDQPIIHKSFK